MATREVKIEDETQERYLTYALSVVSGRALPDVRDGLKPVQRRILYAMLNNLNLKPAGSHRKSAAVVGEVLARFHPHGDTACYDAMVRMAQTFSLRYPLVDGQGNFGSLDGDSAAAYRYTEAKLTEFAIEVIGEIHEETVHFRDNFDATTLEPEVLPSRAPNLLVNGASGIAVGMATNIPPHNLRDTVEALIKLSEEPKTESAELANLIKAPDFPTGCLILNSKKELQDIYKTGRGQIRMRGEWKTEEGNRGKAFIVITSIPYAIDKSQLVERIANLIIEKKVPQLVDVRDESTEEVRVVLELATGADAEMAMAFLYKNTPLETGFPVNMTALVPVGDHHCRPELLSLKDCLQHFLAFREKVTRKRLEFEKRILEERIHILEGLVIIFDDLDAAIKIVRASDGRTDAAEKLRKRFKLSEIQSFAVVDMRIYQLSRTNIDEIRDELKAKAARVGEIDEILKSAKKVSALVRKDLQALADKYGDKRCSRIVRENVEIEYDEAAYVVQEDVYAIVTRDGWIKRIRQNNELSSTRLREGDTILQAHAANTVDFIALLTNQGFLYTLSVTDFPSSSGYGTPVQKLLKFKDGEQIITSMLVRKAAAQQKELLPVVSETLAEGSELVLVSKQGVGFVLKVEGLEGIKRNGKRAIKLREGDALVAVTPKKGKLALFTRKASGLVIETKEAPVRDSAAVGVSLMGVRDDDQLLTAIAFDKSAKFLVTSESGRDKEIPSSEILSGRRGLKGNKVVTGRELLAVKKV